MSTKITVKRCPHHGRRPNLTPQETAFPYNAEDPVHLEKKTVRRARTGRVFSVIGTVLVWLPIIFTLGYIVFMTLRGEAQPFLIYFYVYAYMQVFYTLGGLSLFVGAKLTSTLHRRIGWTLLVMVVFPAIALFFANTLAYVTDISMINIPALIVVLLSILVYVFCAVHLNILSIRLLRKLFPKKQAAVNPDTQVQPES
jgi:hypothetical protein